MGNSDSDYYNENKVNIFICGNTENIINSTIIKSIFQDENNEYKSKLDLGDSKEYIFLSGQMLGNITNDSINAIINTIKKSISESPNKKNIVVCFSDFENLLDKVKAELNSLNQDKIPFLVFVKKEQFSQNIDEYKKIKQINVINYFGQSDEDKN